MSTLDYSLRPAEANDADFIHALRVAGLRQFVDQIWGWDDEDQLARFQRQFDPGHYWVIVVAGNDVGALSVEWREREAMLADIEILPEWRGRGLGTAVIDDLLAEARRRALPVSLQVLKGNPARRLYERLGFHVVAESATHFSMRATPDRHVS